MQYWNDRFKLQNLDLHFPHFTEKTGQRSEVDLESVLEIFDTIKLPPGFL